VTSFESLRGRRDFTLVMRRGRRGRSELVTVFGLKAREDGPLVTRVGVIIPKTVGKAVARNRVRRRCRAIIDSAGIGPPHFWYVVQCRPGIAGLRYEELKHQLMTALAATRAAKDRRPA
jgi:ribonuclease P protein component